MTALKIVYLLTFCVFVSLGQICFKLASRVIAQEFSFFSLVKNGWLFLGLCDYALCTLFWIWLIRDIPLSKAYPFVSLTFCVVPLMSFLFFGDDFNMKNVVSSFLIIIGVVIVSG